MDGRCRHHPLESERQSPERYEQSLLKNTASNLFLTSMCIAVTDKMTRPLIDEIARSLGIEPSQFRNKALLIQRIEEVQSSPTPILKAKVCSFIAPVLMY